MDRAINQAAENAAERAMATIDRGESSLTLSRDDQFNQLLLNGQQRAAFEAKLIEQGVLGDLVITSVADRSKEIDSDKNGSLEKFELVKYVSDQTKKGFAGDSLGVFAAKRMVKIMDLTDIEDVTPEEIVRKPGQTQDTQVANILKTAALVLEPEKVQDPEKNWVTKPDILDNFRPR